MSTQSDCLKQKKNREYKAQINVAFFISRRKFPFHSFYCRCWKRVLIIEIVLLMSMGLILIFCLIGLFGQLELTFEDNFIVVLSGVRLFNLDCVDVVLCD